MNQNKNIPQLFRDIFKGVFLPYRDPETLNLFLKEIDGFSYDHSERLGDAFEYLLSVLGTQGDAGQFRTPRHIIDFIVAVVDPKKSETVLDPACGTAGFLISAYKHILRENENLTPDDRARLMSNFRGYDIAPDMVRLSRVNMYLHGFPSPVIHEYDTLTSEERWDERCDVILANPPFMTPKGGIRPHNRFSIKAKRSEVLFVDYMAEHLNPGGRAGIIVPEGIIFQSQNAYKALRKMLIEEYLWAVVSLPAGVFNPYAGVKTSVLLLDRNLAKRTNEILFVKVGNDGFDLGAQRRPIHGSQLPEALRILESHKKAQKAQETKMALTVNRKRLLESSDINLSGDRYRVVAARPNGKWQMAPIGDLCNLQNGRAFKPTDWERKQAGGLPIIRIQNLNDPQGEFNYYSGKVDDRLIVRRGDLLFSWSGSRGTSFGPHIWDRTEGILNQHIFNLHHKEIVERRFFYWMLKKAVEQVEENLHGGVGLVHITKGNLERIAVPLPPLAEQERIVAELEGYRKVIEGARQILGSYKPTIRIDPKWPTQPLGQISKMFSGGTPAKAKMEYWQGSIPWISPKDMKLDHITDSADHISKKAIADSAVNLVPAGSVLCVVRSGILAHTFPVALTGVELAFNQDISGIVVDEKCLIAEWLLYVLRSFEPDILAHGIKRGGTVHSLQNGFLRELPIPLPPLSIQSRIVAELASERKLVDANRELISRMEAKIKVKLAEVWGEEATHVG
jgi:type I restriction enzyme M protein